MTVFRPLILAILCLCVLSLTGAGCGADGESSSSRPSSVEVSFPYGPPSLGQTASLVCRVKAAIALHDMTLEIHLPEGLELLNGSLSWRGDIAEGDQVEVVNAVVVAVKTGRWVIDVYGRIDPDKHDGQGGEGSFPIYLSISEDSAEYGPRPPWVSDTTSPP